MRHSNRAQEIRVGIISIVAIVALIGGIIWGKGFGFDVAQRSVAMRFPNAAGIEPGSAVTFNGVRKGSVTSVRAFEDHVVITAFVESDVPLRRDARARIEMAEITGGKRIALFAGRSTAPLRSGTTIHGTVAPDAASLISDLGDIGGDARVSVRRLDTALASLNAIVSDPVFRRRIDNTLINLEDASGQARAITVENRAVIDRTLRSVDGAAAELRVLVHRSAPTVDRTLAATEQATADIRRAVASAENALFSADTLMHRLDSIAVDLRRGTGAATMLLYDSTFANELRATVAATRALIEDTRRKGLNINFSLGRR